MIGGPLGNRVPADGPAGAPAASPWIDPAGAPGREPGSRSLRRAVERLTVLLLLATVGVAVVAWLPVLGRVLDRPLVPGARRGIARELRARGYATVTVEADARPRIGAEPLSSPHRFPRLQDDDRSGPGLLVLPPILDQAARPGQAVVDAPIDLLDRADERGEAVLHLQPGAVLDVERAVGDWLLLGVKADDEMVYGWVRRAEVLLVE